MLESYKKVLTDKATCDLTKEDITNMKQQTTFNLIRSVDHNLQSITINKTSLCSYESKRYYLDSINSRHFQNNQV